MSTIRPRAYIGILVVASTFFAVYMGNSLVRGSLLDDTTLDTALRMRADANGDGTVSTRELRKSLVDVFRGVLQRHPGYDIDGDGTVSRSDLTSAKGSFKRIFSSQSCGNGIREGAEECDYGPSNGLMCDTVPGGGTCTTCSEQCTNMTIGRGSYCGDGLVTGFEACDDGNTESADGCSSTCSRESGYTCKGTPSTCVRDEETYSFCGNAMREGAEECDYGASNGLACDAAVGAGGTCTYCSEQCTLVTLGETFLNRMTQ